MRTAGTDVRRAMLSLDAQRQSQQEQLRAARVHRMAARESQLGVLHGLASPVERRTSLAPEFLASRNAMTSQLASDALGAAYAGRWVARHNEPRRPPVPPSAGLPFLRGTPAGDKDEHGRRGISRNAPLTASLYVREASADKQRLNMQFQNQRMAARSVLEAKLHERQIARERHSAEMREEGTLTESRV